MVCKKKLYKLDPQGTDQQAEVKVQNTKRQQRTARITPRSNERNVREQLAHKICGDYMGLWLLVPEYLRLGAWDFLQGLFDTNKNALAPQMGMQMVNESALCLNRLRKKGSLCHQGFATVNGLSFLATDESIHELLTANRVASYEQLQSSLLQMRYADGHYDDKGIVAIDPHRIPSASQRTMPKKKKKADQPSVKMYQTFFCNDIHTGQPLGFVIGNSSKNTSRSTLQLMNILERGGLSNSLILADKEHFSREIAEFFYHHPNLDILVPAPGTKRLTERLPHLDYRPLWAGYAIAESEFSFKGSSLTYRLIVQREGEQDNRYKYKAFITTSPEEARQLIASVYAERWSIEEFFNFEGEMAWNRASTFNLNIRYGKQSLALLAQAATYRFRQNLPGPYKQWSAASLADKALANMEGDIRVKDDSIIVTLYKDHERLNIEDKYSHMSTILENEGISPKIPWLFDYKLEFRFK